MGVKQRRPKEKKGHPMMTTKLNENILTVVTPIAKATADKAFSALVAKDDKENVVCMVTVDPNGNGSITEYGLVCNSVVDGKLAVVLTMPMNVTMDDVKARYGKALVEVNRWIDKVAEAAEAEIAAIDGIFAE